MSGQRRATYERNKRQDKRAGGRGSWCVDGRSAAQGQGKLDQAVGNVKQTLERAIDKAKAGVSDKKYAIGRPLKSGRLNLRFERGIVMLQTILDRGAHGLGGFVNNSEMRAGAGITPRTVLATKEIGI
jgi:hypothetical protein